MALNRRDRAAFRKPSQSDVEATLIGVKPFLVRSLWIGKTNHYAANTIERIHRDRGILTPRKSRDLARYIATSSILHCNDGWSYLGRAMSAALAGDPHRSLHLAYYAELRAAISLLATIGIGAFNRTHFTINGRETTSKLYTNSGTHRFVWDALEYWSKGRCSGELFATVVRPAGVPLDDWLYPVGGASAVSPQASAWFLSWGQDIRWSTRDRDLRNDSSYQPDGYPKPWAAEMAPVLEYAKALWRIFQPTAGSEFDALDRQVLRLAIERRYQSVTGDAPGQSAEFESYVGRIVANQHFGEASARLWQDFLMRRADPVDNEVFARSRLTPAVGGHDHLSVMSRAALLLRLASGSVSELMGQAGISGADTEFWWSELGSARGMWTGATPPDPLTDMWADVRDALDEVEAFQNQNLPDAQTNFRVATEIASTLPVLGAAERIGLWAVHKR